MKLEPIMEEEEIEEVEEIKSKRRRKSCSKRRNHSLGLRGRERQSNCGRDGDAVSAAAEEMTTESVAARKERG